MTFAAPRQLSPLYLGICSALATTVVLAQVVYKATGTRPVNWLSVEVVALAMFWIVHFIYPLFWVLGWVESRDDIWFDTSIVCKANGMAVCGLGAFAAGYNFIADRYQQVRWENQLDPVSLKKWQYAGTGVFLLGAMTASTFLLLVGPQLFEGGYSVSWWGYVPKIVFLLTVNFLTLGFCLMTLSATQLTGKWKIGIVPKIALLIILAFMFVMGYRSLMLRLLVIVAAGYSEFVKRVSFKAMALVVLLALFLMAVGGVARESPRRTLSSFIDTAMDQSSKITISRGVLELGSSVRTLYKAVEVVPDQHDYFMGKLKVEEVASVVPFGNKLLETLGFQSVNSAQFLTLAIYGDLQTGVGSSVFADVYLDFGFVGMILGMILLGWFCKYVQQRSRSSGALTWCIAYTNLIAIMPHIARGSVLTLVREVLWPVALFLVISFLFGIARRGVVAETEVANVEGIS